MPRQRTQYRRRTYDFPGDFPERLKRFQEESGLPWAGDRPPHRDLSPHRMALDRRQSAAQRETRMALLEMAESLGLGCIFTE